MIKQITFDGIVLKYENEYFKIKNNGSKFKLCKLKVYNGDDSVYLKVKCDLFEEENISQLVYEIEALKIIKSKIEEAIKKIKEAE